MALPRQLEWPTARDRWASQLDPLLAKPTSSSIILKNVSLAAGTTVVNHLLGRVLQGWKLVRVRSAATIYDEQDSNQTPNLTLVLNSSAAVIVDIEVF